MSSQVTRSSAPSRRSAQAEAVDAGVRVHTVPYPFERADEALADLANDAFEGAAVLVMG